MDSILLYYSFLNLIFLKKYVRRQSRDVFVSFRLQPGRFVSSRRILDCLPLSYSRFNTFILLILILFFLVCYTIGFYLVWFWLRYEIIFEYLNYF